MLGSYRLFILIKLILFELFGLTCMADGSLRRYRRLRSSASNSSNNQTISVNPLILFVSISVNDYFAVINCSTPDRVPHYKLDWYFQPRDSSKPPRVIWQRGRSNIHRYIAYSPDQFRHFLQIKPIHHNDSGTYMCLDQTSGFYAGVDLFIHSHRNSANRIHGLPVASLMCLVILVFCLTRYTASESQVT